jgi:hypothetical protein
MIAIPTVYAGVQMRSRMEARFAKWCDDHKLKWLYEPEGYISNGQCYLPDFYLPEIRCFVEVKPLIFAQESLKMENMANERSLWDHDFLVVDMSDGFRPIKWYEREWTRDHGKFGRCSRHSGDNINVAWCRKCLGMILVGDNSFKCPRCGEHDGDQHLIWKDPHQCKKPKIKQSRAKTGQR